MIKGVSLKREALLQFAMTKIQTGHTLVVGEPGTGKSFLLEEISIRLKQLRTRFYPIIVERVLGNDRIGIGEALGLKTEIIDALNKFAGTQESYLLIDGLDAARSEAVQKQFRELIADIKRECPRWTIVASIRTYDALKSREIRLLFPQSDPVQSDFQVADIRQSHIFVPLLIDRELDQAAVQSGTVSHLLNDARQELRDLLRVPRHIEFMVNLVEDGFLIERLVGLQSEVQLFDVIWEHYVLRGESSEIKRAIIKEMVAEMHTNRTMSINRTSMASRIPGRALTVAMEELLHHSILSEPFPGSDIIRFQNHTLFDYAIARHLIEPRDDPGTLEFLVRRENTIFYRPSIAYFWTSQWFRDQEKFWLIATRLGEARDLPPSIRLLPFVTIVEQARNTEDLKNLYAELEKRLPWSNDLLFYLLISLERFLRRSKLDNRWWILGLQAAAHYLMAREWGYYVGVLQWFTEKDRLRHLEVHGKELKVLASTARQLMIRGWELNDTHLIRVNARLVVSMVCRMYHEDVQSSRQILEGILDRLGRVDAPIDELYWACEGITNIIDSDPEIVTRIYAKTFRHAELSESLTNMGGFVMGLFSNRKQDFHMCRYLLKEAYEYFIRVASSSAIQALISVLDGYLADKEQDYLNELITMEGAGIRYTPDYSYIWDQGRSYQDDVQQMMGDYQGWLNKLTDGEVIEEISAQLIQNNRFAAIWARTLASVEVNPANLKGLGTRLLSCLPILVGNDTHYYAVEALRAIFPLLSTDEKGQIEKTILLLPSYNASWYLNPEHMDARLEKVQFEFLTVMSPDMIISKELQRRWDEANQKRGLQAAERPFQLGDFTSSPYERKDWLRDAGVDPDDKKNSPIIAISTEINTLVSNLGNAAPSVDQISEAEPLILRALKLYEESAGVADERVRTDLFTEIAGFSEASVGNREFQLASSFAKTLLQVLVDAAKSAFPEYDPRYHATFDHPSWSPAPRIEAAQGLLKAFVIGKSDDPRIQNALAELAVDRVPAVRFHILRNLHALYSLDPHLYRRIRDAVATNEMTKGNLITLIHSIDAIGSVQELVEENVKTVLNIMDRIARNTGSEEIEEQAIIVLVKIYIYHGEPAAKSAIDKIIAGGLEAAKQTHTIYSYSFPRLIDGVSARFTTSHDHEAVSVRAYELVNLCLDFLDRTLFKPGDEGSEDHLSKLRDVYSIVNAVGEGFYFDMDFGQEHLRVDAVPLNDKERKLCYEMYAFPILNRLLQICDPAKDRGLPASTAHQLIVMSLFWAPFSFGQILDLVHRICLASRFGGYPLDTFSIQDMKKFVELCLADYRPVLLDNPEFLEKISDILDLFISVGWSDAVDLVLKLDQVFQ
jgi:hypothetical protein